MERIGKNRPIYRTVWLVLGATALTLLVSSRLTGGPEGPVCVESATEQPGFAGLAAGVNPACIRIYLR